MLVDTGRRNSELRQDFEGKAEQFEPYAICSCPSCGKADWINHFEATAEEAVLNQPHSTPHLQYRAAALAAEKKGHDLYNVGMLYLNAAWCADDVQAYPQAREYRKLAATAFRRSLVDVSCPIEHRVEIEYLIGELHRRAGDFEGCKQHYRQAIPRLSAKYAYMARKLMQLAENGSTESIGFENEVG